MVEAKRTVPIPLNPDIDQQERLYQTLEDYQHCRKRTIEYCWNNPKQPDDLVASKGEAEDALYYELRDETDEKLHANLVQKAIQDVTTVMDSLQTKWEKGETVVAPNNHEEKRSGGHFHCPHCGFEWDRDVVGALNVARKHFDQCKVEEANPVAYMEAGNHASLPSHNSSQFGRLCARSTGVQSTTSQKSGKQDSMASGRQTQKVSSRARSLIVKSGGTAGGLHKNCSSNTGMRVPTILMFGSILETLFSPSIASNRANSGKMLL